MGFVSKDRLENITSQQENRKIDWDATNKRLYDYLVALDRQVSKSTNQEKPLSGGDYSYRCGYDWIKGSLDSNPGLVLFSNSGYAHYFNDDTARYKIADIISNNGYDPKQLYVYIDPINYDTVDNDNVLVEYANEHGVSVNHYRAYGWNFQYYEKDGVAHKALIFGRQGNKYRYRILSSTLKQKYSHDYGYPKGNIYKLAEAIDIHKQTGLPLVLCNGERSVVVAHYYNIPAIAIAGESSKFPFEQLKNCYPSNDLIIFGDNDESGLKSLKERYLDAIELGYNVKPIRLNNKIEGYDLADYCGDNTDYTASRLLSLEPYKDDYANIKNSSYSFSFIPEELLKKVSNIDLYREGEVYRAIRLIYHYFFDGHYYKNNKSVYCFDGNKFGADGIFDIGVKVEYCVTLFCNIYKLHNAHMFIDSDDKDTQKKIKLNRARLIGLEKPSVNNALKSQIIETIPVFDYSLTNDVFYVNAQNGVYDIKNNTILPHSKDYMFTHVCNASVDLLTDDQAKNIAPMFQTMMRHLFIAKRNKLYYDKDTDKSIEISKSDYERGLEWFYMWLGKMLSGSQTNDFMHVYGIKDAGKSTLFFILNEVLGGFSETIDGSLLYANNDDTFGNSNLFNVRLAFCDELDTDKSIDLDSLKSLTSPGGSTLLKQKYLDSRQIPIKFSIMFGSNRPIVLKQGTLLESAFIKRYRVRKCYNRLEDKQIDSEYLNKIIESEKDEILSLLCYWSHKWYISRSNKPMYINMPLPNMADEQETIQELDTYADFYFSLFEKTLDYDDTVTNIEIREVLKEHQNFGINPKFNKQMAEVYRYLTEVRLHEETRSDGNKFRVFHNIKIIKQSYGNFGMKLDRKGNI